MRIALNDAAWKRAISALSPKNAAKAGIRAVNRTATNARAAIVPLVAADVALQQKFVRDRITIQSAKATGDAPVARLFADTERVPLIQFKARGPEPSRGRGRGVRATLPTGAGTYPHAFIATMKSGHRGVYQRKGKARLAIYELRGPSIAKAFEKHADVAASRAADMLDKNFAHEMNFLIQQATQ